MKAWELKKTLTTLGWRNTANGSKHSIAIPGHKEIAEGTAKAILKEAATYGQARGKA